jgi:hypothetical protein
MQRRLFLKIVEDVERHDSYFAYRANALGNFGLRGIQKIASSIQILAYGGALNANDEYIQIGESMASKCLYQCCKAVIELYSNKYLQPPNKQDIKQLLAIGKDCGFPGMLGSIDCMHWEWKNCPTAWHGVFQGKEKVRFILSFYSFDQISDHEWISKVPTIVLEAVTSQDLWIWHAWVQQQHLSPGCLTFFHRHCGRACSGLQIYNKWKDLSSRVLPC